MGDFRSLCGCKSQMIKEVKKVREPYEKLIKAEERGRAYRTSRSREKRKIACADVLRG